MKIGEHLLLLGPNRRSDRTMVEEQLLPDPAELEALATGGEAVMERLAGQFPGLGAERERLAAAIASASADPLAALARLRNAIGIALQRIAGHRVGESGFRLDSSGAGVWCWFEYEHDGVGEKAAELAFELLSTGLSAAGPVSGAHGSTPLAAALKAFPAWAAEFVLPLDTEAIVSAAARLDLPSFKLERQPFPGLDGAFRVRRNGLLMIGHGRYREIVDGTFCVTRGVQLQPLMRDREVLRGLLAGCAIPWPRRAPDGGNCALTRRALRAADSIGYPVAVKPRIRARGAGVTLDVASPEALRVAVDAARTVSPEVSVEAMVPGEAHCLVVAGGEPVALLQGRRELDPAAVHFSTLQLAREVASRLGAGIVALDLVAADIGAALDGGNGAVTGVDPAPELDAMLVPGSPLYPAIAEAFLGWLFPPGAPSRKTIVAVTGTNGKTTTSRMSARILRHAGLRTGLVCSEGFYVDDRLESPIRDVGPATHYQVLERADIDAAVFEEYFGRIARVGFAYEWCDVAVVTNVTNDHLGRIGTHTLEEMAELKFALPRRARHAAILNGDDTHCLAMAQDCIARRVCLVSVRSDLLAETEPLGPRGARCIVEREDDGTEWMVLYDAGRRLPLLRVSEVPATHEGAARFNVSNALEAAAACYFAGIKPEAIAAGLRSFEMSFKDTPGRLNRFNGLPFTVVMDYAHNADGFRQLVSYVDRLQMPGRKILMVGFTGDRRNSDIEQAIAELAGHFDLYVCRNFLVIREGRDPLEIPQLIRRTLLGAGVADHCIHVVPDAVESVHHTLGLAQPGDLVVLLVGNMQFQSVWDLLQQLAAGNAPAAGPGLSPAEPS